MKRSQYLKVSDMALCDQSLATIGGVRPAAVNKFAHPVTIEEGKEYVIDLAINLEGLFSRGVKNSHLVGIEDANYHIMPPAFSVVPLIREATQKSFREEYLMEDTTKGRTWVVDLFFAGDESGVGTSALTGAQVYFRNTNSTSATDLDHDSGSLSAFDVRSNNGIVKIRDEFGKSILEQLTRATASTRVGDSLGSATVIDGRVLNTAPISATLGVKFNGITQL